MYPLKTTKSFVKRVLNTLSEQQINAEIILGFIDSKI
ncbi:hypothetical protein COLO4_21051 [Corchorus olitorius]|uniref:Uncharacterized protein n=1 Tax=Corchorus olitorius TaxID=93759 RepID=A0A1R3IVI9_9ROSI|nr:hypothetical protein COLO4_21051 [Corchorus olitorius]